MQIADNFFGMIENLSSEVRQELLDKITQSLESRDSVTESKDWKKLFGTWSSEKDADEIIAEIRSSRSIGRIIEDL